MPQVRRFHSPFRHWVAGVMIEIVLYAAFIALCMLAAFTIAALA